MTLKHLFQSNLIKKRLCDILFLDIFLLLFFNKFKHFPLNNFKLIIFTSCQIFMICLFIFFRCKTSRKIANTISILICFITN